RGPGSGFWSSLRGALKALCDGQFQGLFAADGDAFRGVESSVGGPSRRHAFRAFAYRGPALRGPGAGHQSVAIPVCAPDSRAAGLGRLGARAPDSPTRSAGTESDRLAHPSWIAVWA